MIAILYVQPRSHYFGLKDVQCWDEIADARHYSGPAPVVAHPPCQVWSRARCTGIAPEMWGKDGGCFEHALNCVLRYGGVLEHPAFTWAWKRYNLQPPQGYGWTQAMAGYWVGQLDQGAYGHKTRKTTWLLYAGRAAPPAPKLCPADAAFPELRRSCSRKQKNATPPEFADLLIGLARAA